MNKKTSEKILNYIANKGQASGNELALLLGITTRAVRKQLSNLFTEGKIHKIGKPPQVFYLIKKEQKPQDEDGIPKNLEKIINENYLIVTPTGEREEGLNGFRYWCKRQNLPLQKTAVEYERALQKYTAYKKGGLINGMYKMKHTFDSVYLDKIFYLDFYSIERFGKTKLGQLLLYAKQSQNKDLIHELVTQIKSKVNILVKKYAVNAVGFIPPTVKREVQLMRELERQLNLSIPSISLVKVKTPVAVPQKTLTKLEDRVENAKKTIVVDDTRVYDVMLLIDDALGSGSTLNETAWKIKKQGLAKMVIGLAITGSFSGFEVISEV